MTKTQYFSSPAHLAPICRVHTYDNGAFVSVDVYTSKHATSPVRTQHFAAGDTTPVALFAARSNAALWVAKLVEGHTELTASAIKAALCAGCEEESETGRRAMLGSHNPSCPRSE